MIGFIGAGKVGKALGLYFKRHGLDISGYYSRTLKSAKIAAELTGTNAFESLENLAVSSDVVFITTPDYAIESIDAEAADLRIKKAIPENIYWIHVSGALPSYCLAELTTLGYPVGSMHPLLCFGNPQSSAVALDDALFSIEGTERAIEVMLSILKTTGGRVNRMTTATKPLYHAGACVISNFLVTLLDSGARYFEAAGIKRELLFDAISPLIDTTIANVRDKGTIEALTGPIVRGDYNTLQLHLQAIKTYLPTELKLYKAMAEETINMIADNRITNEQEQQLLSTLEGT